MLAGRISTQPLSRSGVSLRLAKCTDPLGWQAGLEVLGLVQQARGSLGQRKPEAYATAVWWQCRDAPVLAFGPADSPSSPRYPAHLQDITPPAGRSQPE